MNIEILRSNYNWLRIIRFVFGAYALIDGVINRSYLEIIIGSILLYQAIRNVGCSSGACSVILK